MVRSPGSGPVGSHFPLWCRGLLARDCQLRAIYRDRRGNAARRRTNRSRRARNRYRRRGPSIRNALRKGTAAQGIESGTRGFESNADIKESRGSANRSQRRGTKNRLAKGFVGEDKACLAEVLAAAIQPPATR